MDKIMALVWTTIFFLLCQNQHVHHLWPADSSTNDGSGVGRFSRLQPAVGRETRDLLSVQPGPIPADDSICLGLVEVVEDYLCCKSPDFVSTSKLTDTSHSVDFTDRPTNYHQQSAAKWNTILISAIGRTVKRESAFSQAVLKPSTTIVRWFMRNTVRRKHQSLILDFLTTFSLYGITIGCNYVHHIFGRIWYLMAVASVGFGHAFLLCPGVTANPYDFRPHSSVPASDFPSIRCRRPTTVQTQINQYRKKMFGHTDDDDDDLFHVRQVAPGRLIVFFLVFFVIGECLSWFTRNNVRRKHQPLVLDFLATFSLYGCTIGCNYVHRIYGPTWYLMAVASVGFGHAFLLCPGVTANPVTHVVSYIARDTPIQKFVLRFGVHAAASLACHPLATLLWQTLMADVGGQRLDSEMHCMGHVDKGQSVDVAMVFGMELLGTLVVSWMTMVGCQLSIDIYGTAARVFIGCLLHATGLNIPAVYLNPVLANTQLLGCSNRDVIEHVMVYWIGPLVGACVAAYSTFTSQKTQNKLCRPSVTFDERPSNKVSQPCRPSRTKKCETCDSKERSNSSRPCMTFDECPSTEVSKPCRPPGTKKCEICDSKSRSNSSRPCRCPFDKLNDEFDGKCCEDAEPSACRPSGCRDTSPDCPSDDCWRRLCYDGRDCYGSQGMQPERTESESSRRQSKVRRPSKRRSSRNRLSEHGHHHHPTHSARRSHSRRSAGRGGSGRSTPRASPSRRHSRRRTMLVAMVLGTELLRTFFVSCMTMVGCQLSVDIYGTAARVFIGCLLHATAAVTTCGPGDWQCGDGQCVPARWHCDGSLDCHDHTDEANCPVSPESRHCSENEFYCKNSHECIHQASVCDANADCGDGTDEAKDLCGAVTCLPNHFQCNTSGNCIPELLKCDGIDHCDDGSDKSEALCDEGYEVRPCDPEKEFDCSEGFSDHCVPFDVVCDGKVDCRGGEDENRTHCILTQNGKPGSKIQD